MLMPAHTADVQLFTEEKIDSLESFVFCGFYTGREAESGQTKYMCADAYRILTM